MDTYFLTNHFQYFQETVKRRKHMQLCICPQKEIISWHNPLHASPKLIPAIKRSIKKQMHQTKLQVEWQILDIKLPVEGQISGLKLWMMSQSSF